MDDGKGLFGVNHIQLREVARLAVATMKLGEAADLLEKFDLENHAVSSDTVRIMKWRALFGFSSNHGANTRDAGIPVLRALCL